MKAYRILFQLYPRATSMFLLHDWVLSFLNSEGFPTKRTSFSAAAEVEALDNQQTVKNAKHVVRQQGGRTDDAKDPDVLRQYMNSCKAQVTDLDGVPRGKNSQYDSSMVRAAQAVILTVINNNRFNLTRV